VGTLFIIATPIGNLEDITVRALRILRGVPVIAAEDTRHSRKLLNHYDITAQLVSYHDHNKQGMTNTLLKMLERGDVAVITDAGTPCISDPGYELVGRALEIGAQVDVISGANAITTALCASGLPSDGFRFLGFPPRKESQLKRFLDGVSAASETLIFYESPNRLLKTLAILNEVLGARQAVVAIELTKFFEQFQRGTLPELAIFFETNPVRGEVTLLVAGQSSSV